MITDSFVQAILFIKNGDQEQIYLVLKDPENVNINDSAIKV